MKNPPKTIEEARAYPYFHNRYQESRCAYEVGELPYFIPWWQCSRRNGHGINGLYCKQHAEIVERMIKDE